MLHRAWLFILETTMWVMRIALALILAFDELFLLRCIGAVITGGILGVHQWIVHISTMGEPFATGQALNEQIRNGYLSLAFSVIVLPAGLFLIQHWASRTIGRLRATTP